VTDLSGRNRVSRRSLFDNIVLNKRLGTGHAKAGLHVRLMKLWLTNSALMSDAGSAADRI
jgi:hypothetical protein